ncbi:hypothetical protein NFI96_019000, partial [Prochilodus magdalenae]
RPQVLLSVLLPLWETPQRWGGVAVEHPTKKKLLVFSEQWTDHSRVQTSAPLNGEWLWRELFVLLSCPGKTASDFSSPRLCPQGAEPFYNYTGCIEIIEINQLRGFRTSTAIAASNVDNCRTPTGPPQSRWTVRDDSSSAAAQCSVGLPPQDAAPTGRCPHRTLPPRDAAPTGRCPQDAAQRIQLLFQ